MIRFFDLVLSIIGLLILSPLFLFIALWIKAGDRGAVFFLQTRVGKDAKSFKMIKFRTMKPESERSGQLTVGAADNRITPVGRVLRKYKLDELPQLFNVLKGTMSMVGPRPEVPKYVSAYTKEERRILEIKPGITDMASLRFFRENELLARAQDPEETYVQDIMPKKIQLNMEYVEHRSISTYFKIILKTIWRILS